MLLSYDVWCSLGGGEGDAEDVMKHIFFDTINFKDLFDKKVMLL